MFSSVLPHVSMLQRQILSIYRATGADLPNLSNEAMAKSSKGSLMNHLHLGQN